MKIKAKFNIKDIEFETESAVEKLADLLQMAKDIELIRSHLEDRKPMFKIGYTD